MGDKQCGLYFSDYKNLKQHLLLSHSIPNKDEFQLLMKYGNARTTDSLDCQICGKKQLVRLDKHLIDKHIITSSQEREPVIKQAKRAAIVKKLAALRQSCPEVPMVSTLDKGLEETGDLSEKPIGRDMNLIEKGKEMPEEEDDLRPELEMRDDSLSNDYPSTRTDCIQKCSTPIPLRNPKRSDENVSSSSDPHQTTSWSLRSTLAPFHQSASSCPSGSMSGHSSFCLPGYLSCQSGPSPSQPHQTNGQSIPSFPGTPPPSSGYSSMTQGQQLTSTTLPGSVIPMSCEMELPSSSPPQPFNSQTESSYRDPHQSTSQPPPSTPVLGFENSSSNTQSRQTRSISVPGSMNTPSCESGIPTGSVSKACTCNCEQFASRLLQLEQRVDHLMAMQPQTPSSVPLKAPISAQKWEHVGKGNKNPHLFHKVLDDFFKFRLGSRTGRKDKDNARQATSHAFRFCFFMAADLPSISICKDLRFLNQMDKLRTWPRHLQMKGYAPTSMKNMMNSVTLFMKHIHNSFLSVSKLRPKDLSKILYEMQRLMADIQRKVLVHRQKVLCHKTADQLEATQEAQFMMEARKKITKLFECLTGEEQQQNEQHTKVMGYIMGYLSILTGHRSIVLTNMTKENVAKREAWNHGKRFQILVDDHKTVKSFGHAVVSLNEEEFGCLVHLTNGMCFSHGQASPYVFHTIQGKQILKPVHFLQLAWADSGMKGTINFNKIRSSVSTQAQKYLSEQERREVAKSMCHDPQTAEKFYVALPDKKTGYKTRNLRLTALQMASGSPSQSDGNEEEESLLTDTPETSSDDEEPSLDDHPDSESSVSSEELRKLHDRRQRSQPGTSVGISFGAEEEESLPSTLKSKNRQDFSHQSEVPKKKMKIHSITPLKGSVKVERLKQHIVHFHRRETATAEQAPVQISLMAETPAEEIQPTPEFVPDTLVEQMAETPAEHNLRCVPEPMTCQSVPETTPDLRPETPAEESSGFAPEPMMQQTPQCEPDGPAEECVSETSVEESSGI